MVCVCAQPLPQTPERVWECSSATVVALFHMRFLEDLNLETIDHTPSRGLPTYLGLSLDTLICLVVSTVNSHNDHQWSSHDDLTKSSSRSPHVYWISMDFSPWSKKPPSFTMGSTMGLPHWSHMATWMMRRICGGPMVKDPGRFANHKGQPWKHRTAIGIQRYQEKTTVFMSRQSSNHVETGPYLSVPSECSQDLVWSIPSRCETAEGRTATAYSLTVQNGDTVSLPLSLSLSLSLWLDPPCAWCVCVYK